jgi:sortase (surface protein transpeptidase)
MIKLKNIILLCLIIGLIILIIDATKKYTINNYSNIIKCSDEKKEIENNITLDKNEQDFVQSKPQMNEEQRRETSGLDFAKTKFPKEQEPVSKIFRDMFN